MSLARALAARVPLPVDSKKYGVVDGKWAEVIEPVSGVFTKFYESSPFSLVVGTPSVLAHGFGSMPLLVRLIIREVTGNTGFGLGTEIYFGALQIYRSTSSGLGAMVVKDATNIRVTPGALSYFNALGTAYSSGPTVGAAYQFDTSDNGDWRAVVRAWG